MATKDIALALLSNLTQYMRLFKRFINPNKLFNDILTISEMMCDKQYPTEQTVEQINKYRSEMCSIVHEILINDSFFQKVINYLVDVASVINYSVEPHILATVNIYITSDIKQVKQFGTNQMTIANNINSLILTKCENNDQKYRNIQLLFEQLQNIRLIMSRFEHDNLKAFLIYIEYDLQRTISYLTRTEQDLDMQFDLKILTKSIDDITKIIDNRLGYSCETLLRIKEIYVDIKLIIEKYKYNIDELAMRIVTDSDDESYSEYD